jgi:hypothetical protein
MHAIPTCGIVGISVQADPSQYCSVMLPREMISRPKIMCLVKDLTNVMNRYDFVLRLLLPVDDVAAVPVPVRNVYVHLTELISSITPLHQHQHQHQH